MQKVKIPNSLNDDAGLETERLLKLWFAKIAIGIQIKELTDPLDFVCARMILRSCCAC